MNSKAIRSVLNAKMSDWLKSINDKELVSMIRKNLIVTGGSIASMLLGEEVKDYDVYFRDKATTKAVAEYYVKKFNEGQSHNVATVQDEDELSTIAGGRIRIVVKSAGVAAEDSSILNQPTDDIYELLDTANTVDESDLNKEGNKTEKYRPVFLSSNAITLSNKIQIVIRFYGEPKELHENYDFAHCTNYWEMKYNKLVLDPLALECLLTKTLIYLGSRYPVCSVIRTRKFIKRGFHINAGQYLKMLFQVSQLDLTDLNVLEDQLIGVDSSYFQMLINALKSKQKSDENFKLTNGYLVSIIDRIF